MELSHENKITNIKFNMLKYNQNFLIYFAALTHLSLDMLFLDLFTGCQTRKKHH